MSVHLKSFPGELEIPHSSVKLFHHKHKAIGSYVRDVI